MAMVVDNGRRVRFIQTLMPPQPSFLSRHSAVCFREFVTVCVSVFLLAPLQFASRPQAQLFFPPLPTARPSKRKYKTFPA